MYPKVDGSKVKLTNKGIKQIRLAAKKLKAAKIDLIFSSDLFRTRQTSKILAKKLGIKKVVFSKKLRDINLGPYMGGKKEDYYKDFPKKSIIRFSKTSRGLESWNQCQRRIVGFVGKIDKKHKGKKILIVSHGDSLWLLEGWAKNWSKKRLLKEKYKNYINTGQVRKLYGN